MSLDVCGLEHDTYCVNALILKTQGEKYLKHVLESASEHLTEGED